MHGETRKPGAYPYQQGLMVLKAVTLAGGFTDRAAEGRTKVLRIINAKEQMISVNMEDAVQPEDIIIAPESFF